MKFAIIVMLGLAGLTATAADTLRFEDNFVDGDLTSGTAWKMKSGKTPWTVSAGAAEPSGKVIFDSLSTSDFKPVTDGSFRLKFDVIFTSPDKTGDNRFSFMLRDSAAGGSGYSVTLAQSTSNNSGLDKLMPGSKTVTLKGLAPRQACNFPVGTPVPVRFDRSPDGKLTVFVNDKPVLEAVDTTLKRFDTVQFTMRCKTPEMRQKLAAVSLSIPSATP